MQVYLLLEIMDEKNVSRRELAKKLNISYNSLTQRLNKKIPFKVTEANVIKRILKLNDSEFIAIFFN